MQIISKVINGEVRRMTNSEIHNACSRNEKSEIDSIVKPIQLLFGVKK